MGQIILRLDRVMADRKMSLNELSARVGVANVNLSKMKNGKALPRNLFFPVLIPIPISRLPWESVMSVIKMLRCVLLETLITSQKNSLHLSCLKMNAKSFMILWLKHINRCLKMVNSIGMITAAI